MAHNLGKCHCNITATFKLLENTKVLQKRHNLFPSQNDAEVFFFFTVVREI